MKHSNLFKSLMLLLAAMLSQNVGAYNLIVNGLCYNYNLTDDGMYVTGLTVTYQNETAPRYTSISGDIVIPDSVTLHYTNPDRDYTLPVTAIDEYAFEGCTEITAITINCPTIGDYAFKDCTHLTSVTIGKSAKEFLSDVFQNCTSLNSVIWYAIKAWGGVMLTDYGPESPFAFKSSIKSFVFGDEVKFIPENLCLGLTGLTSISIPESVTGIGYEAFKGCTGLNTVIWNAKTWIPEMPDDEPGTDEEAHMFDNLTNIKSFVFGNEVETIPSYLCNGLKGLTEINIPASVTFIGENAFASCSGLETIQIADDNNVFDSRDNCNAIIETNTNSLITGCKNTTIPNSVTSIGSNAFSGCTDLTEISIPKSINSIGRTAFYSCTGLRSIYNHINHPEDVTLYENVFEEVPKYLCTLYVTQGRVEEYRNADQWKDFNNIAEGDWIIPVDNLTLQETELSLFAGDTATLHAQILPADASYLHLNWQSSDPSVASVEQDGFVVAHAVGSATITATTIDGTDLSDTCEVIVNGVIGFSLNKDVTHIYVGETDTLMAIFTPDEVVNKNLIWQSSDTTVVEIRADFVSHNGSWQELTRNFDQSLPFKRIRVKPQNPDIYYCEYFFSRQPDGVRDGNFSVNTSNGGICDNGNQYGSDVLTDVGDGWYEYEFSETLYLLEAQENVGEGYVQVFVEPATNSSGETIAMGENVTIMAKAPGTATITATTTDGTNLSASCQVNTSYEYALTADTIEHLRGDSATIVEFPVELINNNIVSGLQFEVELPEGVSLVFDDGMADVWLENSRKARDHGINVSELGDNHFLFMISSPTNKELKGHDGTLFYMKLLVDQYHNAGIYNINFTNLTLAEANETEHSAVNTSSIVQFNYMLGDADADAKVDVADYITTALYIMSRPTIRFYEDAANVHTANPDINVTDLTGITNIALGLRPNEILHSPAIGSTTPASDMEPEMDVSVKKLESDRWMLSVEMNNDRPMAAMQLDLQLPDGVSFESAALADRACRHQLSEGVLTDGSLRLMVSAFNDVDIEPGNGEVLNIILRGNPAVSDMSAFSNITITERNLNSHALQPFAVALNTTAIYETLLSNDVRIYVENGSVVIDSPVSGTAQLVRINGISTPLNVQPGHNVYPISNSDYYIVRFNGTAAKLKL